MFQLFAPHTGKTLKAYLKGIIYIVVITWVFSFIFRSLLFRSPEFSDPFQAFITAFIWQLQDLSFESKPDSAENPYAFQFEASLLIVTLIAATAFINNIFRGISEEIKKDDENSDALITRNLLISHFYYADFLSSVFCVGKLRRLFRKKYIRAYIEVPKRRRRSN